MALLPVFYRARRRTAFPLGSTSESVPRRRRLPPARFEYYHLTVPPLHSGRHCVYACVCRAVGAVQFLFPSLVCVRARLWGRLPRDSGAPRSHLSTAPGKHAVKLRVHWEADSASLVWYFFALNTDLACENDQFGGLVRFYLYLMNTEYSSVRVCGVLSVNCYCAPTHPRLL